MPSQHYKPERMAEDEMLDDLENMLALEKSPRA
jgi:hypothetical protein